MALLYVATAAFRLEAQNVQGVTFKTALFIPYRTDKLRVQSRGPGSDCRDRLYVHSETKGNEKEDWNFPKTAPNQAVLPV